MEKTLPLYVGLGPSDATRACERVSLAMPRSRGTGPRATVGKTVLHRRARACPSPGHDRGGQAPALRWKKTLSLHVGLWENLSLAMCLAGRLISPVDQDRLILIRSGSGDPELQRWARCPPVGDAHHSSLRAPNVWQHRDREVSPTGKPSRPGGLSYRGKRVMKHPHVNCY